MPPRMIPDLSPESIAAWRGEGDGIDAYRGRQAEAEVYRQLKLQLPADWSVIYGYDYVHWNGTMLRDGEVDFIVSAPGKGLMFLEVKAAHGFECIDGIWHVVFANGNRQQRDDPFKQATGNKHNIVEKLARILGLPSKRAFPGLYGHMVVCPSGRLVGRLPVSQEPLVFLQCTDMPNLHSKILGAFDEWGGGAGLGGGYTAQFEHQVTELLTDNSRVLVLSTRQSDFDERRIEELTKLQYDAVRQVLQHPRVLVRGTAGSGKTMIAMWAAEHLVAQGQKVLLVCYNKSLAEWIKLSHPGTRVRIIHFHGFCREAIRNVDGQGISWDPASIVWEGRAAELVWQSFLAEAGPERYDSIIVDEAQDFHPSWWDALEVALKDPDDGRLCVFLDPQQKGVYGQEASHPAGMLEWELDQNCRNTQKVVGYCSAVLDEPIKCFALSPVGVPPEIHAPIADIGARSAAVKTLVNRLLGEHCRPSSIALLTPWKGDNTGNSLTRISAIAGIPVRHIGSEGSLELWIIGEAIIHSTIKSFKGLEAEHVIVTDLYTTGQYQVYDTADLFVAASRAKHRLYLFPVTPEAHQQLVTWLACRTS